MKTAIELVQASLDEDTKNRAGGKHQVRALLEVMAALREATATNRGSR